MLLNTRQVTGEEEVIETEKMVRKRCCNCAKIWAVAARVLHQ